MSTSDRFFMYFLAGRLIAVSLKWILSREIFKIIIVFNGLKFSEIYFHFCSKACAIFGVEIKFTFFLYNIDLLFCVVEV